MRKHGVTVTALCPGPVETGFAEAMGLSDEEAADVAAQVHVGVVRRRSPRRRSTGSRRAAGVVIPGVPEPHRRAASPTSLPRRLLLPVLASRHPSLKD